MLDGTRGGLELLDRVRSADGLATRIDPSLPVLVLSGRAAETDRVRGFARGADDYVTKPFSYAELVARVRALLRRADGRPRRGALRGGGLPHHPPPPTGRPAGRPVQLSPEG